ncbi:hypothetical protein K0A97_00405 [Patescibacteria group bacterium]|nr:hypothetical protein [Patescibacteria group bacterium]
MSSKIKNFEDIDTKSYYEQVVPLEDLVNQKDSFILFDTSSFMDPLGMGVNFIKRDISLEIISRLREDNHKEQETDFRGYFKSKELKRKIALTGGNNHFLSEFLRYLKGDYELMVTPLIIKEIHGNEHYSYKRAVKKQSSEDLPELRLFRKKIRENEELLNNLERSFVETGKVLLSDETELKYLYPELFDTQDFDSPSEENFAYSFLENSSLRYLDKRERIFYRESYTNFDYFRRIYKLSDTDYDMVLKSLTLSLHRKPVIISSNDGSLISAVKDIISTNCLFSNLDVRFFKRVNFFEFKEF